MKNRNLYPFTAVVGLELVKQALLIDAVNPKAGGLLLGGLKGTAKTTLVRSLGPLLPDKLVELPLNVTEDMLFGSIDIEYAVSKGERRFQSGLLGRANGGLLYIDEANLLRQELLVAVLDANMAGYNHVERDGISFTEAVQYTVIGTMNPEEGLLTSNILDRFGMYVEVESEKNVEASMEIIRRVLRFEANPLSFCSEYAKESDKLKAEIMAAKSLLSKVQLSEAMLQLAAQLCTQAYCAGHRAELYLLETARAIAALAKRAYVLPQDLETAAVFVLPHRMRKPPEEQPFEAEQQKEQEADSETSEEENTDAEDAGEQNGNGEDNLPPSLDQQSDDDASESQDENKREGDEADNPQNNQLAPDEQIAAVDRSVRLPKLLLEMGKDRLVRRGSGKRSITKTDLKQGRYVRAAIPKDKLEDLAFDATIRAAAPFQRLRENNGCALNIQKSDWREKLREKRIGNTFLFLVDASGSMGASERMSAVKGAILQILLEAYQKRDRVGMIAFRRQQAEVLLPITRSVDLAKKCLAELPTGGKTPLADGLGKALLSLSMLNKREAELEPILILVTDGRANAVEDKNTDPVEAALKMATKIREAGITSLVIDTEKNFIKLGLAKKVAAAMGANYYTLTELSRENVIRILRNYGK